MMMCDWARGHQVRPSLVMVLLLLLLLLLLVRLLAIRMALGLLLWELGRCITNPAQPLHLVTSCCGGACRRSSLIPAPITLPSSRLCTDLLWWWSEHPNHHVEALLLLLDALTATRPRHVQGILPLLPNHAHKVALLQHTLQATGQGYHHRTP